MSKRTISCKRIAGDGRITLGEFAERCGVSTETLKTMRRRGYLPHVARFDPSLVDYVRNYVTARDALRKLLIKFQ